VEQHRTEPRPVGRRDELLEAATDHVLTHGLIGLTLRPLAAAIGTSDRMLIYHFGSHARLVAAITSHIDDRGTAFVQALPDAATVKDAVQQLWAAHEDPALGNCLDIYIQAAATGQVGTEPYRTLARESNQRWNAALRDYFERSGAPAERVGRIVGLVDSALLGFHLDSAAEGRDALARGVEDLAHAAQQLAQ
jgi:AcrR family transcriptional regulator